MLFGSDFIVGVNTLVILVTGQFFVSSLTIGGAIQDDEDLRMPIPSGRRRSLYYTQKEILSIVYVT
jgi:hypothetical protein